MLKCTMLHSYPREYYEIYESFCKGGSIRLWINAVERMGRRISENDPDVNLLRLRDQFAEIKAEDWDFMLVGEGDNAVVEMRGPKNNKVSYMMNNIGAHNVRNYEQWVVSLERLISYINRDTLNKFKGDMLEVLSEMFFNIFYADEGMGIKEYTPVQIGEDFGVDAVGVNVNGHKVAIQVKYRTNPADSIAFSDIARTFTAAVCQLKMMDVVNHDHTIFLFTTSNGTSAAYQRVMGRKSVVIARPTIATKIDNNLNFWGNAFLMISETLNR